MQTLELKQGLILAIARIKMLNFVKNIGPTELIVLAAILILLFGGKAFISLARTAGKSFKEIKNIKKNFTEAIGDGNKEGKK